MSTEDPYIKTLSFTDSGIIDEIEKNRGKQSDPVAADIMLKLIEEGKIQCD